MSQNKNLMCESIIEEAIKSCNLKPKNYNISTLTQKILNDNEFLEYLHNTNTYYYSELKRMLDEQENKKLINKLHSDYMKLKNNENEIMFVVNKNCNSYVITTQHNVLGDFVFDNLDYLYENYFNQNEQNIH